MEKQKGASRNVGRPTDFRPEYVEQAAKLCRLGALDTDLAEFFNTSVVTLNAWKKAHPEFLKAIKEGKAVVDRHIADRLIHRAEGAEWIEQKEVKLKTVEYADGKKVHEEERVEVVDLKRAAPPDTTAIIFFLKNRRPDLWRDKQEVQHSTDPDAPPTFTLKIDNS